MGIPFEGILEVKSRKDSAWYYCTLSIENWSLRATLIEASGTEEFHTRKDIEENLRYPASPYDPIACPEVAVGQTICGYKNGDARVRSFDGLVTKVLLCYQSNHFMSMW